MYRSLGEKEANDFELDFYSQMSSATRRRLLAGLFIAIATDLPNRAYGIWY